jgi:hypothetical protein
VNLIIDPVKQTNPSTTKPIIQTKPKETNSKTSTSKKDFKPIGIIGAGVALLYFGLKNPMNTQLYKLTNKKIFSIEEKTSKYTNFVKETISKIFADIPEILNNLKETKQLKPFQEKIQKAKSAKEVLETQEKAFNEITPRNQQRTQEIDNIKDELEKRRLAVWDTVKSERNKNSTIFTDIASIPPFKDGSNQKLVDKYNQILFEKRDANIKEMNQFTDNETNFYKKFYAKELATIIKTNRDNQNLSKEKILQDAFKKLKNLLQIEEDFSPSYFKELTLEKFSKLSSEELKPQKLPVEMSKLLEGTPFADTILKKDFNNISEQDLKNIFYRLQANNSLKDLRYLIDKFRLEKEVSKAENSNLSAHFDIIIPKLEYLSIKLKEVGEKEIIKYLSKNFSKMKTWV